MIEVNLLPEELRKKALPKLALPEIPPGMLLKIFILILIAHFIYLFFVAGQYLKIGAVKQNIETLKITTRNTATQKAGITAIQARLRQIDGLTERKFYWTQLLNTLSDLSIKEIWLTQLSISERQERMRSKSPGRSVARPARLGADTKKSPAKASGDSAKPGGIVPERFLKLEGSAVGQGQETALIGKFIKEIKKNAFFSSLFSEVELANITQRKIKDVEVYDFLLECRFNDDKVDFS
jgi:hypothetical protein